MGLDEDLLIYLVLSFLWTHFLWERYLAYRQLKTYRTKNEIPDVLIGYMKSESFVKARLYGLAKLKFVCLEGTFGILFVTLALYFRLLYFAWSLCEKMVASMFNVVPRESEILVSCCYIIMSILLSTIFFLPLVIYAIFGIEDKYGFNKASIAGFVIDVIKSVLIALIITVPVIAGLLYIIKLGGNFVLWIWLFTTVCLLLLITVFPVCIAPRFDKHIPLPEGSLKAAINRLASEVGFPLSQVYIAEVGSKRTGHSNAYFTGLFGQKRIVLFDTLLEKYDEATRQTTGCSEREVVSIIAHEMGHWKCNHVAKGLLFAEINLLLSFIVFWFMFKYPVLYRALGFPAGQQPVLVGLIAVLQIVLAPYNTFVGFLGNVISRHNEYQADNFAASLTYADALISALIKLAQDNLDYPYYDHLFAFWHLSHPTIMNRIDNLKSR